LQKKCTFCTNVPEDASPKTREIEFVQELPMTTTGKIMRRELRKMDMEKEGIK